MRPAGKIGVGWQGDKYGWMSFVAFNKSGTMVASDGPSRLDDVSGALTLWTFPKGHFVKQLRERPQTLSGNWKYYASSHDVVRLNGGASIFSIGDHAFASYAFSPDSRFVAEAPPGTRLAGSAIDVFALPSARKIASFGKMTPSSLAFSPDEKTLAAGYWDIVALWNTRTKKRVVTFRGFGGYVESLSFSRDGTLLAGGTDRGTLQLWNTRRRTRIWSLDIEGSDVSQPAISPNGKLVAVGTYGTGTVWLIDAASGKMVDHRKVSDLGCGSVAFSPNGRYLITPSTGGLVTWPYDVGGTIRVFKVVAH